MDPDGRLQTVQRWLRAGVTEFQSDGVADRILGPTVTVSLACRIGIEIHRSGRAWQDRLGDTEVVVAPR